MWRIADVTSDKDVTWVLTYRRQIIQVTGIGKFVEINNRLMALSEPIKNKIRANETGPSRY
jgi:hypothetical protein